MERFKSYTILGLILLVAFLLLYKTCGDNKQIKHWKSLYMVSQNALKEGEGQYSQILNKYLTQRKINTAVKSELDSLYQLTKDLNERILYYQKTIATFKPDTIKVPVTIFRDPDNPFNSSFTIRYPEKDHFIQFVGSMDLANDKLYGNWSFTTIPIYITLTEQKDKLWKARIKGPDFLQIESVEINSLPPEKIVRPKFLRPAATFAFGRNFLNQQNYLRVGGGFATRKNLTVLGSVATNATAEITLTKIFK